MIFLLFPVDNVEYKITLIDFSTLNQFYIYGINITPCWCTVLFIHCAVLFPIVFLNFFNLYSRAMSVYVYYFKHLSFEGM